MKATTSSGLNRQQQVKVVIRLKPDDPEARFPRCVYLSDRENELVVETDSKKELFLFDHIAHQLASQADIYRMIGQEVVHSSVQGFNSCVFAYGQTGAGKTYSVMGSLPDLQADHYADTRGLLPRIVEDVFNWATTHPEKCSVICSYMEVYNQQIFDLLAPEKRIHQIREDFKRGVFVEGLIEKRITSYRQGIEAVLEGEKTRRMASTAMNTQSSRSHAIFTLTIQTEVMEEDVMRVRRSKLNIVDLAGSERVKHTHVMGEQLKEGCNINRSLHVLGNVINSLVESAKKKKHIPFRDSKLTHYLKDSLGGNSLTKLLANVHTNKLFLGDTLSTLMFAKRAKSLKMKVEVNQNITENFDSLRKQVKRLREELAQARYFKGETQRTERPSFQEDSEMNFEKITETQIETAPKTEIIQVFEENELHYKALIEVYEEHLSSCSAQGKGKQPLNMVGEWKNLQKKNTALAALVCRFPAFTKIYKENLMLREQERNATILEHIRSDQKERTVVTFATDEPLSPNIFPPAGSDHIQRIIHHYQGLMQEMQTRFQQCLQTLQRSYHQIQVECRQKDKRLKEFMRKVDLPPDVQDLKNENQYLHLNILNLENEICQIHQHDKLKQERKEHKQTPHRNSVQEHEQNERNQHEMANEDETQHAFFMSSLQAIKEQMERDMQQVESQREETDALIEQLRRRVSALMIENQNLKIRTNRSRSQKRAKPDMSDSRASSTNNIKSSFSELLFLEESAITSFSKKTQNDWEEQMKGLHEAHHRELQSIRVLMAGKEQQIDVLRRESKDNRMYEQIEEQFGKKITDILQEYRQNARRLGNTRSMANIRDFKEPVLDFKIQQKPNKKGFYNSIPESRVKMKEEGGKAPKEEGGKVPKQARMRRQELGVRNPMINAKKPFLSSK